MSKTILNELLNKVVNRNGGKDSLVQYYKDQGLKDEILYNDLLKQIPPLDRKYLGKHSIKDVELFFKSL